MKKLSKKQKLISFVAILLVAVIVAIVITTNIISNNNRVANEGYLATTANAGSSLIAGYILNGITIGGITGTMDVLDTSDATAIAEDILFGKSAYVDGVKIDGTMVDSSWIEIGKYVEYTPDEAEDYFISSTYSGTDDQTITQEDLKWRIFNINSDDSIDLIASTPTTTTLNLRGKLGINNGVYYLNNICNKLYSNTSLNAEARSIKMEDLESKYSDSALEETESSKNSFNYGTTLSSGVSYRSNVSAVLSHTSDASDSYYTSPTTETGVSNWQITLNYYYVSFEQDTFNNENLYNMLNNEYFLATRYSQISSGLHTGIRACSFGLAMNEGDYQLAMGMGSGEMLMSDHILPIVEIKGNVKFSAGDGSEEHPFKISI